MGVLMASNVGRAHGSMTLEAKLAERKRLKSLQAMQSASDASNSQKEPVPSAQKIGRTIDSGDIDVVIEDRNVAAKRAAKRPKGTKPDVGEFEGDEPETSEQRIKRMAQAKHEENAAIDSAVALTWARRGLPALKGEALRQKSRIDPTPEIMDEIFLRVAEGESLYTICADAHMPHRVTIGRNVGADAQLFQRYQAALHQRADKLMEQVNVESAELKDRAAHGATTEEVKAHQVFINSLQWTAAKLHPAKYGEKTAIDLTAKVTMTPTQVNMRLAVLLAKAQADKPKDDDADGNS